jgi:hypothetical protein
VRGFSGNLQGRDLLLDAASRRIMSWRAPAPQLQPGEEAVWSCAAQLRQPTGAWLSAGELHVTQHRLIWQPPRWAQARHRVPVSYALNECTSFWRDYTRPMGRYPSWGARPWKRMELELATGQIIELAVRRPNKAVEVISGPIVAARDDQERGTH